MARAVKASTMTHPFHSAKHVNTQCPFDTMLRLLLSTASIHVIEGVGDQIHYIVLLRFR